jgi:hypothetical protein
MNIRLIIITLLAVSIALWVMPEAAHGQTLYVTNFGNGPCCGTGPGNTIGKYDAVTGAGNPSFITTPINPAGIAVKDGVLYFNAQGAVPGITYGSDTWKYDANTGVNLNGVSPWIQGAMGRVSGLALYGDNIYLGGASQGNGEGINVYNVSTPLIYPSVTPFILLGGYLGHEIFAIGDDGYLYSTNGVYGPVAKWDSTTGALITPSLLDTTGLTIVAVNSVAVSAGKIWAAYAWGPFNSLGAVGVWDANTGAQINATLVSGISFPQGIAVYGGKLYVALALGPAGYVNGGLGTIAEYDATTGAPINTQLVSGLNNPYALAIVAPPYAAQIQPPINSDGSSIFNANRGVVPVKFTLTQGGTQTCTLPSATIALTRTSGGTIGTVDESVYVGSADTGSNFRIDSCQYVYNLSVSALGVGTYRVDILINGQVVGSGIFQLQ